MRAIRYHHAALAAVMLLLVSGVNSFCTDFAVLPFVQCETGEPCFSQYKVGASAAASYRVSPGVVCGNSTDSCSCYVNATEGIKITQPRVANLTLDEDDEEALYLLAARAAGIDFPINLNTTVGGGSKCITDASGAGVGGFYVYTPAVTCVTLLLLGCDGGIADGTVVRACAPYSQYFPDELYGELAAVTVPSVTASSYLDPAPTPPTLQPLSVTLSSTGYRVPSYTSVTPMPTSFATAVPDYPNTRAFMVG